MRDWVDSLLAANLGLKGGDSGTACVVNGSLNDYRPVAMHQVGTDAPASAYLYCGWSTSHTVYRALVSLFGLLAGAGALVNLLKLRSDKAHVGVAGVAAAVALAMLVAMALDANAVIKAQSQVICDQGVAPTSPKPDYKARRAVC